MSTIKESIIALEEVNRKLDRIKNDPTYIEDKVKEIFGDKKYITEEIQSKFMADISAILSR